MAPCKQAALATALFDGARRAACPVVSPVNASRRPSRDAAHHSGSGRMASPYPMGDFHLLFFASFPGALCARSIASVAGATVVDRAVAQRWQWMRNYAVRFCPIASNCTFCSSLSVA
jgi:hypothetical protein